MNHYQIRSILGILAVSTNLFFSFNACGDVNIHPLLEDVVIEPFPILSWVPPKVTEEHLNLYQDAGFTVMTIGPIERDYQVLKKYWKGNYILSKEWRAAMSYDKMIAFHGDDPKLIGFLIGDEPDCKKIDAYKNVFDRFRKRYPEKICLVNLFPTYVGETRLGCSYFDYIDKYFEKLQPRYCSLDHYPCLWFNVDLPDYYLNLEILRHHVKKNNSKQIGFVQVYSSNVCREVSESDLAWQVNTFLAYGCKGLWYFNYRHPAARGGPVMKNDILSEIYDFRVSPGTMSKPYKPVRVFGSAVLDEQDRPDYAYPYVKARNKKVLAWGKLLTRLTSVAVRHAGYEAVPGYSPFTVVGTEVFRPGVDPIIENLKWNYDANDAGFIISYFKDGNGNDYVMIVNKKHGENLSCNQARVQANIEFKKNVRRVYRVSNRDGGEKQLELNKKALVEKIGGGEAILLRMEMSSAK